MIVARRRVRAVVSEVIRNFRFDAETLGIILSVDALRSDFEYGCLV